MPEQKQRDKNDKKPKPDDAISLKQFSTTQQAKITLAADQKNESIGKYMSQCVVQHIDKTVRISFSEDPALIES